MFSWLSRRRRALGFGVHSPFAYRLIKETIGERCEYYAYEEFRGKARKDFWWMALVLRFVSRFQPSHLVLFGATEKLNFALEKASPLLLASSTTPESVTIAEKSADNFPENKLAGLNQPMAIVEQASSEIDINQLRNFPLVVVLNLNRENNLQLWHQLIAERTFGMDFTISNVGMLCALPHLPRQSYPLA